MENGKVLSVMPIIVKSPKGILEVFEFNFADIEEVKICNT